MYYADGRNASTSLRKYSLNTRDRDVAFSRIQELDHHVASIAGIAEPKPAQPLDNPSIIDGWQRFLDHKSRHPVLGGIAQASQQRYVAVRDKHVQFCRQRNVERWDLLDCKNLEDYGNHLAKTHAQRTVVLELNLIKSVNHWLIANGFLHATARIDYPLRKPTGTNTYCYRPSEVGLMIAHCRERTELQWLADVILALAHTGMRIGELANLRWSDINLEQNFIRVSDERAAARQSNLAAGRTTKGRRSRVIPIHPLLHERLIGIRQSGPIAGYVFRAFRGGKLRPRNVLQSFIDEVIEKLADRFPTPPDEIGFRHGRLHSFRHFFCSQALFNGASEGDVREWLGHADSKMVEHYRHLHAEDSQRRMRQINFLRESAPAESTANAIPGKSAS